MIKKLFILFAVIAGTLLSVHAQDIPEPMTPKRIVNDFTGLFSTQERAALEKKLVNFNNNSSTQIAVSPYLHSTGTTSTTTLPVSGKNGVSDKREKTTVLSF